MIPLIYTDSGRVLGAIGLTPEDVDDNFMMARDLQRQLSVDLFNWLPTHASVFVAPGASATATAQYESDCLVLYCTHFCAAKVASALLGVMATETDGQNAYKRFDGINLQELAKTMNQQAGYYRQTLLAALSAVNVASRVSQYTIVAPSYDPITG